VPKFLPLVFFPASLLCPIFSKITKIKGLMWRKIFRWLAGGLAAALLAYGVFYLWQALPIISAYGAKTLCSCTMVAGRAAEDVIENELGGSLLRLGTYRVNFSDSSAEGSVWGLARKKAIYRKGLGCTLVNDVTEAYLRTQNLYPPQTPLRAADTLRWPAGDRLPETDLTPYDMKRLEQVADTLFAEPVQPPTVRTRALIIVHNGNIILERYAKGFDQNSRFAGWSMTKSLTNGIVGILVKEGVLNLNQNALLEEWKTDARAEITLNHLMQASSGLHWEEVYSGPSATTNMLFKEKDAGQYAARFPLQYTPGEVFAYSSGTTNIISRIIRQAAAEAGYSYPAFAYQKLFHQAGMYSLVIEPDPSGTLVGSSFAWATARDWARFGLLYLNDGYWLGQRLLPEGWVEYTTTPAKAAPRGEYGAQFWLNAGQPGKPENRTFPDAPPDMFYMSGYEDQYVFIIPSENLVVVRLGLTSDNYPDYNSVIKNIITALPR
jgi:CubicO group peptidase (beta-lactamase class C family)